MKRWLLCSNLGSIFCLSFYFGLLGVLRFFFGFWILLVPLVLGAAPNGRGKPASEPVPLIHQVLFELDGDPLTTYDFKKYLDLRKVLRENGPSWPQQSELDEFLMMEICYREAVNLQLETPDAENFVGAKSQAQTSMRVEKASPVVKSSEKVASLSEDVLKRYLLAREFLLLKQKPFAQEERYRAWVELLKKKYNFLVRSEEIKTQWGAL